MSPKAEGDLGKCRGRLPVGSLASLHVMLLVCNTMMTDGIYLVMFEVFLGC